MRGYREFLRAMAGYLGLDANADERTIAEARDRRATADSYLPDLMADAGIGLLLVDTGYGGATALAPATFAKRAGVETRTVVRIEQLAERILGGPRAPSTPGRFADAVSQAIDEALGNGAVGMKSVAAYRSGLDIREPASQRVRRALGDRAAQARRIDDPALVATVVRAAAAIGHARGIPLQIHTGFGDEDLHLPTADPGLLRPLLRDPRFEACPIVLLHCYPFVAEAGYLASVYPSVHVDLSLTIPLLGAVGARAALSQALGLCPATKLLAGSDGHSYPEMHWRGAGLWRESLAVVLGAEVAEERMSAEEAASLGTGVLSGNAQRLYRLD